MRNCDFYATYPRVNSGKIADSDVGFINYLYAYTVRVDVRMRQVLELVAEAFVSFVLIVCGGYFVILGLRSAFKQERSR